jgi:asparagine synthase (glutamine-hydrolysing)
MCGIAGLLGITPDRAMPAASRMLAAMQHRGPDDHGVELVSGPGGAEPPAVLVHARLAILDLSPAGHQPMRDRPVEGGPTPNWIVFNGEVFNYQAIRTAADWTGWPCRTECDTEVILHAYRLWGEASVERMRGMFAWCLLDTTRGTAWFCRDRMGIKPLYIIRPPGGGLLFASEVRTLLAAGPEFVPPRVSACALESFLAQGAVFGLESLVEGITLVGPGESLVTDWSGRPRSRRTYWHLPTGNGHRMDDGAESRAAAVGRIGETLREAVKLRLIADVPLGLFLSGGVDSSALATIATEVAGTTVETISIGFDQPEFDETDAAQAVAKQLGTHHQVVRLTGQEVLEDLPDVLASIDQPTVDGFNTYFVSRAARRAGLTVALSGLGGDELFGGYASFRDAPKAVALRRQLRWMGRLNSVLATASRWSGGRRGIKASEMFRRRPDLLPMVLLRRELFLPEERRFLQPLPEISDASCGLPLGLMDELGETARDLETANQISSIELSAYMSHMLLRDGDVFSMAHGLEVRLPFLDHKLVEEVLPLPGKWKRPDPRMKPLLVDAVGARLPREVYTSTKRGFTFPWDAWLRGALRERAASVMEDHDVWAALGIAPAAPACLWSRFLRRDPSVAALQVLALVVLAAFAARHGLHQAS